MWHAKLSQKAAASITHTKPYRKTSGVFSKTEDFVMPPLIVSVTDEPSRTAPPNSHTAATRMAWPMVRAFAPTEEANELATSLAPMPKAQMKEKMQERPKSQV